jgi:hypothetical protein
MFRWWPVTEQSAGTSGRTRLWRFRPSSGDTSGRRAVGEERRCRGIVSIETGSGVLELVEPELVTDPELRPASPHVRFVERRIAGVTQYLRMRAVSRDSATVESRS